VAKKFDCHGKNSHKGHKGTEEKILAFYKHFAALFIKYPQWESILRLKNEFPDLKFRRAEIDEQCVV
jgi:hypothetical protein